MIHKNTLMKILCLKSYKLLLFQNQQVRIDFLVIDGTKHWYTYQTFFKKIIEVGESQCQD